MIGDGYAVSKRSKRPSGREVIYHEGHENELSTKDTKENSAKTVQKYDLKPA